MHVTGKPVIIRCMKQHPAAEGPMTDWFFAVDAAEWNSAADMKRAFRKVENGGGGVYEFEIAGGYLIVARIVFRSKAVKIEFAGTMDEYEGIIRTDD
jgi:mRNA-degrading endonuclease HigB of HigAB toxin-antitoxin module